MSHKSKRQWAPWATDPDDPADFEIMDEVAMTRAAENVARMFAELVDHSNDGPLKPVPDKH